MSNRRMFNKQIVESDIFLDLPLTTQALYFHLSMNADDDGFVNPKRIVRMIGADENDLNNLIHRRYVIAFDTGVVVVKHWLINNMIRADRYTKTTYTDELSKISVSDNKRYSVIEKSDDGIVRLTDVVQQELPIGQPNGNQMAPVLDTQLSIVKNSLVDTNVSSRSAKASDMKKKTEKVPTETITKMIELWQEKIGYEIHNEVANRRAIADLIRKHGEIVLVRLVDGVALTLNDKYAPRIPDYVALKYKQNDLLAWGRRKKLNNKVFAV